MLYLRGSLYGGILLAVLFLNPRMTLLGVISVLAAYGFAALIGLEKRFLGAGFHVYNPFLVGLSLGYRFQFTALACLFAILAGVFTLLLTIPLTGLLVTRWKLPVLSLPYSLASSILYLVTARFTELTAVARRLPALLASDLGLPAWLAGFFKAFGCLLARRSGGPAGQPADTALLADPVPAGRDGLLSWRAGQRADDGLDRGCVSGRLQFQLRPCGHGHRRHVPCSFAPQHPAGGDRRGGHALHPRCLRRAGAIGGRSALHAPLLPDHARAVQILRVAKNFLIPGIAGLPEEVREHWLVVTCRYPGSFRTLSKPAVLGQVEGVARFQWPLDASRRVAACLRFRDSRRAGQDAFLAATAGLHDYYCYPHAGALAPVRGRVVKWSTTSRKTRPAVSTARRNWGNLVLLEDPRGFCVELSFRPPHDPRSGGPMGRARHDAGPGNSGYSAQPHIHVQVQSDARIVAPTLPFSFVSYRHGDVFHANDLPRQADEVEPLCPEPQLDFAATFLPDNIQQFEIFRGGQPAGKVDFRVVLAADGAHYFQSPRGWLSFGKHEGTFYCFRLEGDDPWLRLVMLALPRLPLSFKHRLAWKDSIPAGMALTGILRPRPTGKPRWPAPGLCRDHATLCRPLLRRIIAGISADHDHGHMVPDMVPGKQKARVELDVRGGFASIQVGDVELKRIRAESDAAPLPSQPQSHKRRRFMTVTAIACLAMLAAVIGADNTSSNTTDTSPAIAISSADSEVRTVLKRSTEAERVGDYAKGIAALMEQYDGHSRHYALNLRLGWLNYLSGKHDEAHRCYKAAIEAAPKSIEAKLGDCCRCWRRPSTPRQKPSPGKSSPPIRITTTATSAWRWPCGCKTRPTTRGPSSSGCWRPIPRTHPTLPSRPRWARGKVQSTSPPTPRSWPHLASRPRPRPGATIRPPSRPSPSRSPPTPRTTS